MATTNGQLKYRWQAIYKDGSSLEQPEDDRSKTHDDSAEWNPSSFRDIEQDKVRAFLIRDAEDEYGVDLESGEFMVNGKFITLEEQNLKLVEPRRLIYFREVRQDFIDGVPQDAYVNRYFIGWQAKDKNGKSNKYTMGVS